MSCVNNGHFSSKESIICFTLGVFFSHEPLKQSSHLLPYKPLDGTHGLVKVCLMLRILDENSASVKCAGVSKNEVLCSWLKIWGLIGTGEFVYSAVRVS